MEVRRGAFVVAEVKLHRPCLKAVKSDGVSRRTPAGGEGGIRTHGTLARTTVFETVPFDHSGTSPRGHVACRLAQSNKSPVFGDERWPELVASLVLGLRRLTYWPRLLYCAA